MAGDEGDKGGGEGGRFSIFCLLMMHDVRVVYDTFRSQNRPHQFF